MYPTSGYSRAGARTTTRTAFRYLLAAAALAGIALVSVDTHAALVSKATPSTSVGISPSKPATTFYDPCRDGPQDRTVWIPVQMPFAIQSSSASGFYAYGPSHKPGDDNACKGWVVDIVQYPLSNSVYKYGQWVPYSVFIGSHAFDLPSSVQFGGKIPTTQEDCETFELIQTYYRRSLSDATFPTWPNDSRVINGIWNGQSCQLSGSSFSYESAPPPVESLIHRVITQVNLRGSAQQVEVTVTQPPPR